MKTRKKWLTGLGMVLGLACWARPAAAVGTLTDSVTVTITPIASYLLLVSTGQPLGGLSLGSVNVLTSTYTVNPTTVTVESSYAATGILLEGLVTGGLLTIEPAPTGANLSTDTDKVGIWAVFTDTGMGAQPNASLAPLPGGAFPGNAPGVGSTVVQGGVFNQVGNAVGGYTLASGTPHWKPMRSLPTFNADNGGSQAELWLGLEVSPVSGATQGIQQSLTVVLKATTAF